MPNVTKTKLNRGALIALLFFLLIGCTCLLPIKWWFKVIISVALVCLFLFIRRGYIIFYRAAVRLRKENSPKVWQMMKKALAAHVDEERTVLICTAFIQQDDVNFGVSTLEDFITKCKDAHWRGQAVIALSMGYWKQGKLDKAIELLQDLKANGYMDGNLQINLETYLLEKGDLKEAKKLITESRKMGGESNGLLDNRGLYYLLTGDWTKAAEVYDELINERNAKFPEAYIHGAQVKIHEKKLSQAIDRVGWALSKRFTNTCTISKEYIEKILANLEDSDTCTAFAAAMENHVREVALGRPFPGLELEVKEEKENIGLKEDEEKASCVEEQALEEDEDDDDREPNTDITDEDLADLNTDEDGLDEELSDEDDYDEDLPNTDLNTDVTDDDREPNTDLNEDDLSEEDE